MKSIYINDNTNWDAVREMFGEDIEIDEHAFFEGMKIAGKEPTYILKVEDDFGWDYLVQLPDGRMYFTDRNCGIPNITTNPIENVDTFVTQFISLIEGDDDA